MLRTLAGFLTPDRGTVAVAGRLLSSPQGVVPPERRRMGMVFQNYAVWPHMTVLENVAFGLRIAKVDRQQMQERVTRVLAAVGLTGLEARHPGQLSGGQQQRVALARSLVVEPSILLLDEPLSNLDAKLRERMRVELKALQRRMGLTFIYVTHDQAEAMALSDRIVVFNQGAVQQIGAPREIYERPANLFVADFMGLVNRLPAILIEQAQGTARVRVGPHELQATIGPDAVAGSGAVTLVMAPRGTTGLQAPSRMPRSSATSSIIRWTSAAACYAFRAIDRPHSSLARGSLSPCLLRSARSCEIRVEAMRERSVDAQPPGGRSIGRRKRKTSLRNGEPHEATQHAFHHVGRAQSARARLRRPPDDPHAQPRSPGGSRRALHRRLLQLADLRAVARELSHRALRPPGSILGQRHRL
jgi:iron(III) transport system ATP-binding protein